MKKKFFCKPAICYRCIKSGLTHIHLVDKCLMLFMLVLLLQSGYSIVFPAPNSAEIGNIDVIVRTSSAAIFGYFISANFIRTSSTGPSAKKPPAPTPPQPPQLSSDAPPAGAPVARIGFALPNQQVSAPDQPEPRMAQSPEEETPPTNRIQIIVATSVGLFCLVTLILLRNLSGLFPPSASNASAAATVAQFRDFVSGCVGFLIGCPTTKKG